MSAPVDITNLPPGAKLDDVLESRFQGGAGRVRRWYVDWECKKCRRFGNIFVYITGGGLDPVTGMPIPKTSDEEFYKKLWDAHHEATTGLCPRRLTMEDTGAPIMWRWERGGDGRDKMILLNTTGGPPPAAYKWPTWT